ncbi:hypothetical protein SBDP1_1520009 [Syntrophobacter sp. SbD1]|nr:hypothetical protein SBDP1_1520009 [Syntrophobacter sp. SbD1]
MIDPIVLGPREGNIRWHQNEV